MKRYGFLTEKDFFEAFNRLCHAFLAAKDGNDVREIINALLTNDEKTRIGRRILIAEGLKDDITHKELVQLSNVGYSTINLVSKHLERHPKGFELIFKRRDKLEKDYQSKKYIKVGGSTLVFKKKTYNGHKKSDIRR